MELTEQQILDIRKKIGIPESSSAMENSGVSAVARRRQAAAEYDAQQKTKEQPGFLSRAGEALKERGGELKKTFGQAMRGEISPVESGVRAVGDVIGGVGDVVGAALSPQIQKLAQTEWGKPAFAKLAEGMEVYETWKAQSPANERIGEMIEAVVNIADLAGVTGAGKATVKAGAKVGSEIAQGAVKATKNVTELVSEKLPQYTEKASQLLASEPADQIKTILKETPVNKFDEFVKIGQKASTDPRAQSVFEKVGDSLADATKQLKKQADSIGAQKTTIIQKAKIGLQEFKEAPRQALLKVMKLEDNPLKDKIITKLKLVKTKADADKAIDDIQAMIYDATGTKLIAQGSKIEKQLRGIVGEMNEKLKLSLPDSYRNLNKKFADRIKIVETLNRALGEVVDGVPVRGASLIKQFFSPSGTKTKELFEFIKKNTGIDLAQDTTLAKFVGELFDDPKVRSLLQGIPSSSSGVVSKAIDFAAEKTGLVKGLQNISRKGTIKKARELTQ